MITTTKTNTITVVERETEYDSNSAITSVVYNQDSKIYTAIVDHDLETDAVSVKVFGFNDIEVRVNENVKNMLISEAEESEDMLKSL